MVLHIYITIYDITDTLQIHTHTWLSQYCIIYLDDFFNAPHGNITAMVNGRVSSFHTKLSNMKSGESLDFLRLSQRCIYI